MLKKIIKKITSERQRIKIKNYIAKIVAPIYYGNNFYCNCCEKNFAKFLLKGNIKRENAKCPYCGSLERTRLLLEYLKKETTLFNQKIKVLHFAPEQCLFDIFIKLNIDYIDADIDPNYARNVVDITNINYENNFFDLILCSHVMAHIKNEDVAFHELYRILKKGQKLIIMTLIEDEYNLTIESDSILSESDIRNTNNESYIYRVHGNDFKDKIATFGFSVKSIDYRNQFSEADQEKNRFGDGKRELIFECIKN